MKKFIHMLQTIYSHDFYRIMQDLQESKQECAMFLPCSEEMFQNPNIISQYSTMISQLVVNYQLNLIECIFPDGVDVSNIAINGLKKTIQIIHLSDIKDGHDDGKIVFICFTGENHNGFYKYFKDHGLTPIVMMTGHDSNHIKNLYFQHLDDLYEAYCCLNPHDGSREVFLASILGDCSHKLDDYLFANFPQYLMPGFLPQPGDILFDGGAFDGGTGKMFKDMGCEVYSFELDKKNYENARRVADENGFVLENMGLGKKEEEVSYVVNNAGSWIDDRGNANSKIIDIDTYVARKQLPQVDFIKFDIEGSELDGLRGAEKTIREYKPKLAISIYHKPEDMYTLIRYIKTIRPDYEIAFRHHKCDFSPNMSEMARQYRLGNSFPTCWEKVIYAR